MMRRYLLVSGTSLLLLLAAAVAARAHESHFYTFIDDYHANPSTTDATGEAFFTLNADHTELAYTIVLDGLLGLKENEADRTEPDDIIGMHLHLHVPDTLGPHVLNIFGLPAEEDADLVVDYANNTLSGVYDISDATIDPATGEPALQFYPTTTKIIYDWIDELMAGDLMLAIHTNESGFGAMAIHGHIGPHSHGVPEPAAAVLLAAGAGLLQLATRRCRARPVGRGFRLFGAEFEGDVGHAIP